MAEHEHSFEQRAGALFEPDTLLPSQYLDRVRRRAGSDGERRLMVAVLEDAIHLYLTHASAQDPHRRDLFAEAEEWIEDRDTSRFYSFENVCTVLDLDASYLRRGLRARKRWARGVADEAPPPLEEEPLRRASGE